MVRAAALALASAASAAAALALASALASAASAAAALALASALASAASAAAARATALLMSALSRVKRLARWLLTFACALLLFSCRACNTTRRTDLARSQLCLAAAPLILPRPHARRLHFALQPPALSREQLVAAHYLLLSQSSPRTLTVQLGSECSRVGERLRCPARCDQMCRCRCPAACIFLPSRLLRGLCLPSLSLCTCTAIPSAG